MYETKDYQYFSNIREDLISLLPRNTVFDKVLEIGCGNGATLFALKERGIVKKTYGIDLVDLKEYKKEMDFFLSVNIERVNLPFNNDFFDLIILGDILEHLIDPWSFLNKIHSYLKRESFLIASLPNFRNLHVIKNIFYLGNFAYEKSGILDKTHLRFFCKKNIVNMFSKSNFKIIKVLPDFKISKNKKVCFFSNISCKLLDEFLAFQYFVVAKKNQ
jgi:SAM-dependent methyltransferase